ncbi:MAG: class I SAM-dependent methyltransferase [Thermoleophilia bacterium]|nr:class I SAM-dependent methyltransferase [Thermoleophilia bacterium]
MSRATPGLRPTEDAYGEILLAAYEGRGGQEIMERDDGLIYCGDPADYFWPARRWPAAERRLMRFVRGRVLDIGCGAGRVALHLEQRGHEVVAIDESPLAVEVSRRRGVRDARVLALADVGPALGVFDTILIIRNNLGLGGTEARAARVLRGLARVAGERGRIITDSVDPERIDDPVFRTYRGRSGVARPRAQRVRVRWQHHASPWFHYLMLAPGELERLLRGSGWRVARVVDDGSPRYGVVLERERATR